MHFTFPAIALAVSTLLPAAHANFDIYRVKSVRPYAQGGTEIGWQMFPSDPSCEAAVKAALTNRWWPDLDDVSGNKLGIRCEGKGCALDASPEDIDILEMNSANPNSVQHYSKFEVCARAGRTVIVG